MHQNRDGNVEPLITAVLVLYRMQLQDSRCFQSLTHSLREAGSADRVTLFVHDNSPASTPVAEVARTFPGTLHYQHDSSNGGVAAGYNAALAAARSNGSSWLLLLDQDTELTPEYLEELLSATEDVPKWVVAIIPRLMQNGATHSPQHLPRLSHRPLDEHVSGLLPHEITAYNSGAALRVSAIECFPPRYWLDFLDHAVFHQLQSAGGRVWLLRAGLSHQLSTESLGTEASLDRYHNVLQAERDFYTDYGSPSDRAWYHLRRVKQAAGELLKVRDKRFALLSLRAALGILPPTPPR